MPVCKYVSVSKCASALGHCAVAAAPPRSACTWSRVWASARPALITARALRAWQVCRQLILSRGVIPVPASQFPQLSAALLPAALDAMRGGELGAAIRAQLEGRPVVTMGTDGSIVLQNCDDDTHVEAP